MEANYPQINLGATICEKLKQIYYTEVHWQACYQDVALKFTTLKQSMRKFYSIDKLKFEDEIRLLQELIKYDTLSIQEAMESST